MTDKIYTDITMVLDRSGSMCTVKDDTVGGVNQFIDTQKKNPGYARMTLVQFDSEYDVIHDNIPLDKAGHIDNFYEPRGSTALLDAIGRTVVSTATRLEKMPESDRPNQVLFAIITDGHENASREFKKAKINEMIENHRTKDKWQFVFIGANQDAIQEGSSLGVMAASTMTYDSTSKGTQHMFGCLNAATTKYRGGGQSVKANFFAPDEDKDSN